MKAVLQQLFRLTLTRLALDRVIPEHVTCRNAVLTVGDIRIELARHDRIVAIAIGKAAIPMVEVFATVVAPRRLTGVVSSIGMPDHRVPGLTYVSGGHPYPNASSFRAGDLVFECTHRVSSADLVVYLLSGGGSAICERPLFADIPRRDYETLYQLLVTSGATITQINAIRKHLSAVKGGRLAELASPARQLTLYVSDVPGHEPSSVASGPSMPDESTVDDCFTMVHSTGVLPRLPPPIRRLFDERRIPETPKPGAPIFRASSWHCLLNSTEAVAAMVEEARQRDWIVEPDLSVDDDWPVERVVDHLLAKLEQLRHAHASRPVAIVNGGEYSSPVTGDGMGGRNQAFVLACVPRIAGRRIAVLSAGTDGIDGTSPAAGAIADGSTLERATQRGLDPSDYAARSDSYRFFAALDDALTSGPTGNNVRDLRMLVTW